MPTNTEPIRSGMFNGPTGDYLTDLQNGYIQLRAPTGSSLPINVNGALYLPPPNGSDDTAAISAVFAAVPPTGTRVIAQPGIYRLSAPINISTDHTTLEGVNPSERSGAVAAQGGTSFLANAGFSGAYMINVTQPGTPTHLLSHIGLKYFTVDGANLGGGPGGISFSSYRGLIDWVTVMQCAGTGLIVNKLTSPSWNPYETIIRHSHIILNLGIGLTTQGSDVIVTGCAIGNNGGVGAILNGGGDQVNECHFYGNSVGLQFDAGAILARVSDSEFESHLAGGIGFINAAASNIQIDGCHFWNNSITSANTTDDINMVGMSQAVNHTLITGCQFGENGSGVGKSRYGINLGANATRTFISGCTGSTNAFGTSFINDGGTNTIIASPNQLQVNGFWRMVTKFGNGVVQTSESASPESVITSAIGGLYSRSGGSVGTALYVKGSGTGNTGWLPIEPTAGQTPTETVLVSGVDATAGRLISVTLTAARLVGAPLNPALGQRLTFNLIQGGAGGFAVTWNAIFKVTWSDTGNTTGKRSSMSFMYDGTNWNQDGAQTPYV